MTSEYPKHDILEFCSGGAKQYGLVLRKKNDPNAKLEYVLKIRGITLNTDIIKNQGLHYQTFKERVLKYAMTGQNDPIPVLYPQFLRPSVKESSVFSMPLRKIYKVYVGKGIVSSDFIVRDFGYCK